MLQIILGQDSEFIDEEISKFKLSESDKRYSKNDKKYKLDFVGFCIENNKLLAVFPKHFYDNVNKKELDIKSQENDIELLFNVICKYNRENKALVHADKYIGSESDFVSDYPFDEFYSVYEYYQKYGIYKETENIIKPNTKGRISWKTTIQKSNIIFSNDNLSFLPLYSKNKSTKNVFIGECMSFVINYTIKNFNYFIKLPLVSNIGSNFNFLTNKDFTLRELYKYKNSIFRDKEKKLINDLISFFENYDKSCYSGDIHFKISYFDKIWERMVNKYLNDYFVNVDLENNRLIFEKRRDRLNFKAKTFNDIDTSENKFSIIPDHFLQENENIYVFDSKYYEEVNGLNYKQFTYTLLLGNSQMGRNKNIYSALLLPGKRKDRLHIHLNIPYQQMKPGCNFIIEQYLDVKTLMKNYLNIKI